MADGNGATGVARVLAELGPTLGNRLSTSAALREQHGRGEGHHPLHLPDAVAFATSTEDVSRIVACCAAHGVPVIAFGAGTSLEGHVSALHGGISIDLTGMNRVLAVHAEDLDCVVEAGRHPQAAQRGLARSGPLLPDRPWCRRHRWAAWPRPGPRAPTPSATARCATTCWA